MTCGDKLGDMTNELGSDEYIKQFVSGVPKNYAYKIVNANTPETDRLCGLVVRVSGYRYRGPGFDSRRYQIF